MNILLGIFRAFACVVVGIFPYIIPEKWLPQAESPTYPQLVRKQSLLMQRLPDPEEQCVEPELLNHDTVWVHAIHWRNAC